MYKSNGTVVCDECGRVMDQGLTAEDYDNFYGRGSIDICDRCEDGEDEYARKNRRPKVK